MVFSAEERRVLLAVKGVGPTVIRRLEEAGVSDFSTLAQQDAEVLSREIAARLGGTCWRNSPLARAALEGAIGAARTALM
jgi:predicted flap endonuclease-1-like 5' DNA nuclease